MVGRGGNAKMEDGSSTVGIVKADVRSGMD